MAEIDAAYRKVLGIDHGDARIGIAVSDETASLARAHSIISHVSRAKDAERVLEIFEQEACTYIVVGIPYDSDGGIGPRARKVLRFVDVLKEISGQPVHTWDESGSTLALQSLSIKVGDSAKKRRQASDDRVAALILQDFLDSKGWEQTDEHP